MAHGDAAQHLGEIFAKSDLDQKLLCLAERVGIVEPLGIVRKLANRLDVGRKPSQPVGGALLAVEQTLDRVGLDADTFAQARRRVAQDGLGRKHGLARQHDEFEPSPATVGLGQHCCSPDRRSLPPARKFDRPAMMLCIICYIVNYLAVFCRQYCFWRGRSLAAPTVAIR